MLQMSRLFRKSVLRYASIILAVSLSIVTMLPAHAQEPQSSGDGAQILQEFNTQNRSDIRKKAVPLKEKQQIMFLLGSAVILLVIITGGLGLAMGVFGKPVFVAHMVFAAFSITLAIAHAIVGLVWFYPF
ncbi:MAG: hypothetical protein ABI265_11595 [Gallionella sp.]